MTMFSENILRYRQNALQQHFDIGTDVDSCCSHNTSTYIFRISQGKYLKYVCF